MSTTFQYQTTYNLPPQVPPAPRVDPNAPIYASEDGVVASLSNSECIFQVRRSGEAHVMTFQVLQALDQCREFRTLEEHAARIATSVPGLNQQQHEGILRVLSSLVQRGLLVSNAAFLERLAAAPARSRAGLRAAFIRACGRPAQLERLLHSLVDYERQHRVGRPYVVLDDSSAPEHLDRHRDLLREFARTTGCKVTYIGPAERAKLVERIGKALPAQRAVAESLVLPGRVPGSFGGGRNWNLATLLSAGGRLVLFDDDQRLPLRRDPALRPGLGLGLNNDLAVHFHANAESARGAGEDLAGDPFDLHLDHCGAGIGEVVGSESFRLGREVLRGANLSRLAHLRPDARVLGTLHGTYGSARSESAQWIYHLDAPARHELCSSREDYLRNIEAQHVWMAAPQARLLTVAPFTPFALDNTTLLPWTNPVGRGEDRLFSALAHFCHPEALVLDLPYAIGHVQEQARNRSTVTRQASTPRVNHFVADFVQRQFDLSEADDPARRLGLLGAMMADLASASPRGRIEHLREYLNYVRAGVIDGLQQQFEAAGDAPVFWQADVRSIIEANGRALLARNAPRLGDWADSLDEAGCAQALGREMQAMADYCHAWPVLWDYAREQGERLLGSV